MNVTVSILLVLMVAVAAYIATDPKVSGTIRVATAVFAMAIFVAVLLGYNVGRSDDDELAWAACKANNRPDHECVALIAQLHRNKEQSR